MPDSYYPPKFWVAASNIHFNEPEQRFGPYTGIPVLTYENLRVFHDLKDDSPDLGPDEIFTWIDPQDVGEGNPHGYESWTGIEGDERYFGWRRVERVYTGKGRSHIKPVGPFYSDLAIVWDRDDV